MEFYNEINKMYFLHLKLGLSQISTIYQIQTFAKSEPTLESLT